MFSTTSGTRASVISASDSCINDKPWPVEPVADGLALALGVHAHAADLRQAPGHVLEHLGEGSHRVAGEEAAPGGDHRLGDRFGTLQEPGAHRSCSTGSSDLYTWKQKSGHTCAQMLHPVQPARRTGYR